MIAKLLKFKAMPFLAFVLFIKRRIRPYGYNSFLKKNKTNK